MLNFLITFFTRVEIIPDKIINEGFFINIPSNENKSYFNIFFNDCQKKLKEIIYMKMKMCQKFVSYLNQQN